MSDTNIGKNAQEAANRAMTGDWEGSDRFMSNAEAGAHKMHAKAENGFEAGAAKLNGMLDATDAVAAKMDSVLGRVSGVNKAQVDELLAGLNDEIRLDSAAKAKQKAEDAAMVARLAALDDTPVAKPEDEDAELAARLAALDDAPVAKPKAKTSLTKEQDRIVRKVFALKKAGLLKTEAEELRDELYEGVQEEAEKALADQVSQLPAAPSTKPGAAVTTKPDSAAPFKNQDKALTEDVQKPVEQVVAIPVVDAVALSAKLDTVVAVPVNPAEVEVATATAFSAPRSTGSDDFAPPAASRARSNAVTAKPDSFAPFENQGNEFTAGVQKTVEQNVVAPVGSPVLSSKPNTVVAVPVNPAKVEVVAATASSAPKSTGSDDFMPPAAGRPRSNAVTNRPASLADYNKAQINAAKMSIKQKQARQVLAGIAGAAEKVQNIAKQNAALLANKASGPMADVPLGGSTQKSTSGFSLTAVLKAIASVFSAMGSAIVKGIVRVYTALKSLAAKPNKKMAGVASQGPISSTHGEVLHSPVGEVNGRPFNVAESQTRKEALAAVEAQQQAEQVLARQLDANGAVEVEMGVDNDHDDQNSFGPANGR